MTPLEEAVARIVDPEAMASDLDISFDGVSNFSMRRKKAKEKARTIRALPEIVKMQEALQAGLDECVADDYGQSAIANQFREALAALQPLKKEAE